MSQRLGALVAHSRVLARTRLYRAGIDLLGQAHRARPLALLVDDAHWLDPDTLGLLALATDELVPQGVVVAVALRADEVPEAGAPRYRTRGDDSGSAQRPPRRPERLLG